MSNKQAGRVWWGVGTALVAAAWMFTGFGESEWNLQDGKVVAWLLLTIAGFVAVSLGLGISHGSTPSAISAITVFIVLMWGPPIYQGAQGMMLSVVVIGFPALCQVTMSILEMLEQREIRKSYLR